MNTIAYIYWYYIQKMFKTPYCSTNLKYLNVISGGIFYIGAECQAEKCYHKLQWDLHTLYKCALLQPPSFIVCYEYESSFKTTFYVTTLFAILPVTPYCTQKKTMKNIDWDMDWENLRYLVSLCNSSKPELTKSNYSTVYV